MALGIVALYLGLAIGLSTWVRPLIGYALWRRLYVLTLLIYGLVTVHGLGTGSDSRTWWGMPLYVASVATIPFLLLMRLLIPLTPRPQPHVGWAALVSLLLLLLGPIWSLLGPLRPRRNASG